MRLKRKEGTVLSAKRQNFLHGAAILAATVAIVKIIGGIYKLPLYNILDNSAITDFNIAYNIYSLLLTISTAGVPVAISRMVSAATSTGRVSQSRKIFSVAMPTFAIIGAVTSIIMFVFAQPLANFMEDPAAAPSIRMISPAVFLCCVIAVYRGFSQGHGDMVPTSISQIAEVACKLVVGLIIAYAMLKAGMPSSLVAAGAISGVVVGLAISIPILARYKSRAIKNNSYELVETDSSTLTSSRTLKDILKLSIPVTLGSSLFNLITIIDTKLILSQLMASGLTNEVAKDLYGVYSKTITLFNFPAAFITPISVSVVPAVAAAIAMKKYSQSAEVMGSSIKVMNLIALPAGVGLTVLAEPIYQVFYGMEDAQGPMIMALMGIASYFVCLQLVTTAIVQANGYERMSMVILPLGGILKIATTYILVGHTGLGIIGAPVSTMICYGFISVANIIIIMTKAKGKPAMLKAFLKPLLCTAIMGAGAWGCYGLIDMVTGASGSGSRMYMAVCMGAAIVVAVVIYAVLIIVTGALSKEDVMLLPKGEKIAKVLRLK